MMSRFKVQGSRFPPHLLRFTMSSVSTALALVLDGIAMSAKTSTSLKKALSYRVVEILSVANHCSDGHQVPEAILEVLQTNRSPVLD